MTDTSLQERYDPAAAGAAAERGLAIRAVDLGRRFGKTWAVRGLNLEVPRGSVYGFLGLNGAGKSTTMKMLMGLIQPTTGHAKMLGTDPMLHPLAVRSAVGYVAERPHFYDWMTVREIVAFVAHYRKEAWDHAFAEHLLDAFHLPRDRQIKALSKGMQAKVGLLVAMAFRPELLILDEPTGGLDPVVRREFVESLLAEYMEAGNTVFISSHLINEIAGLVDHVGVMVDGSLVRTARTDELKAQIKRVRVVYDDAPPETPPEIGPILTQRRDARELLLVVDQFDEETTIGPLRETQPSDIAVEDLTLESLFIEITHHATGRGRR